MSRDCNVSSAISTYLSRTLDDNRTLGDWLYSELPKGLGRMGDHYDHAAADAKHASDEVFESNLTGLNFSHGRFEQEFTRLQHHMNQHVTPMMGRQHEVFSSLHTYKQLHDKAQDARVFFEHEFLPRLEELQNGAPARPHDYEIFYKAHEYSKQLARPYREIVGGQGSHNQTYAAYIGFISHMLDTLPKPANWQSRKVLIAQNLDQPYPER